MEYICKVGTPSGEILEQSFSATDEAALRAELEQKGYYLFTLRRAFGLKVFGSRATKKIPNELLMLFGQELAALLRAGLPLLQSLDVMLERQRNPAFRRSLTTVRDKVRTGTALSEAFRAEGELYPPILSASLVAGERSGNLEGVLRRFVHYVRLTLAIKKRAISASIYPAMLVCMMLVLVSVLVVKVIPQFEGFYAEMEVELPWITRLLMTVSVGVRGNLLYILIGVGVAVALAMQWFRREGSRLLIDRVLLRVPLVGRLMRMYATSQLARTLSSLLSGGLPLVTAMEVAGASVANRAMAAAVQTATPMVREGKSLTSALESTGMLENLVLEMVKVGEQTGALADMLGAIADFYDEEMETRIAAVLALMEPILLVVMAVIVAGMLLAFYLPLFEAISAVRR